MVAQPNAQRQQALGELSRHTFDVLVIGGGITGAGIARDAALRGLKVALVEKDDFASGTSSKSSKLIHGGLRYLEHGEIKLVFESVNERKRLMTLARHLVRPQAFLLANFRGDPRWLITLDVGLWLYDAMCFFGAYRNHRTYHAAKISSLEPGLTTQGLKGGIVYYDCVTDDARLTLENVLDARALGAVVLNHVKAEQLVKDPDGRVTGARVVDAETNASLTVTAKTVINASGPWSDEVRALLGESPILQTTKGVHVVVDAKRLPVRHALMLQSPADRRIVFCIPWGLGRSVVGTTDTYFNGSPDQVEPTGSDVAYLLDTANRYFPQVKLTVADVLSTWSGLRPLLKPADARAGASAVSREHLIHERPGFLTIAGGKLTTYRVMAMEVVDRAVAQLGRHERSTTAQRPLPGAMGLSESDEALHALVSSLGADLRATYFVETYGARAPDVLARAASDSTASERLDAELPYLMAQVDEAVEHEFARTLDDVLGRRVPLLLRARDQGLAAAPKVAARMAQKLGWSSEKINQELAHYETLVASSRQFEVSVTMTPSSSVRNATDAPTTQ